MASAALPQELFDIAIPYLSEDRTASRACALVCRSWLHPARRNLFHTVYLRFRSWNITPFLHLLASNPELGSYIRKVDWDLPLSPEECPPDSDAAVSVVQLLALLSSKHGTTHRITIDMFRRQAQYLLHILDHASSITSYITWVRWGCNDGSRQWETRAARSLASRLRSIKNLTLAQWGTYPFVPTLPFQAVGDLFRPTLTITTLKMENLVFTDGSQFVHFVHAFMALQYFSYVNVKWEESMADILSKGSPKAPPLRSIALESSEPGVSAGVVRWLLDQPVIPRLATIEVSGIVPSEMHELVQRYAPSISNLTFDGKRFITVHAHTNIISCSPTLQRAISRWI
jgi:hypothetical protein